MPDPLVENKNLEIEALRGASILFVLFAHAPAIVPWHQWPLLNYFDGRLDFGLGVDLFFCISGFVISKSLIERIDSVSILREKMPIVAAFLIRRAFRLLPTIYLCIALTLLATAFFNLREGSFGSLKSAAEQAFAVITYWYNWLVPHYLEAGRPIRAFGPFWSLSLEEQFYFLFPLFLILAGSKSRVVFLAFLVVVAAPLLRIVSPKIGVFFRTDAISLGVLLFMFSRCWLYHWIEPRILRFTWTKLLTNIALLFAMTALPPFSWTAATAVVIVWIASYNHKYGLSVPGLSDVLVWIGARSFGIYVIHIPAIRLNTEIWARIQEMWNTPVIESHPGSMVISACICVLVLAEMNYRFVEIPLRNYGRRKASKIEARMQKRTSQTKTPANVEVVRN